MRRQAGLTTRVFVGITAIVAVVVLVALTIISSSVRRANSAQARRGLEQSADLVAQFLAGRERSLTGGARVFVQGPYFRTLVAERRRDDILDQSFEAASQLDADWVFITNELGVLLAKSDEPNAVGTPLGNVPLVAGALRGQVMSGFGVSRDSLLFQAIAVPIAIPGGKTVGVLVATKLVDSLLARDLKAATSSDVLFYVRDAKERAHVAASTLDRVPSLLKAVQEVSSRANASAAAQPDIRVNETDFLAQGASLPTAGGEIIGGFVVLRSRDAELTGIAGVRRSLALAGALGLLLAMVASYVVARQVSRPVRTLADAVRKASDGEYLADVSSAVGEKGAGREITALADAFDALMADLRDKDALVAMSSSSLLLPPADAASPDADEARSTSTRRRTTGGASLSLPRSKLQPRPGIVIEPGAIVANRYLIEAAVGSGGLGIVYRARDRVLGETVAMKVLRPEVVASDPHALERFKQELRLARRISHRNVVRTHDIGESDGVPFLTMEYVDGASLASVIDARGSLPVPAVLSIAKQLMRGLTVAHEQGVIHGDLKPQNLLIGPSGVLKVTDFGVARFVRRAHPRRGTGVNDDAAVGRLAGAIVGTPEYMAPEQLIGEPASARTDIYSAGVVLHECLTGNTPYRSDTPMAFIARKLDAPPTQPSRPPSGIDANLDALIALMTEPDELARPDSPAELFERFSQLG